MADDTRSGTGTATATGDEEPLDVQPSTSEDSAEAIAARRQRGWRLDGINLDDPLSYIKRERLVQTAVDLAREAGILVVSSPPGTGKSSLMQLVTQKIGSDNDNNIYGVILRPSRPNKPQFDLYDWIRDKIGVCYEEKTLDEKLQSCSEVWLLFDDAQRLYGQKFHEFWQDVGKTRNTIGFAGGTKVVVVVSATYYLTNEDDSPVDLRSQPRIEVEDLLLSEDEANELFGIRFVYPKWQIYQSSLFRLTNGNAAAFAIGMNLIGAKTLSVDMRAEGSLTEEAAVKELYEGTKFLESLERCFPLEKIDAESHRLIVESVIQAYKVDVGEGFTRSSLDDDPVIKLKKAGILKKNNRFASPAAASFYYSLVFPRASTSSEPAGSLGELITKATSRLSARRLRVARQKNDEDVLRTPKQAVFQQLFHESIASLLPSSYRIIPEYGTEATINGELKQGELDFYIMNGRKWGLQLLRNGDGIGEHLGRITGKYQNVEADEWLVVDCRIRTGRRPCPDVDRCSLVFTEDFRSCQCYMGLSEQPTTIQLME